MFANTLFEVHAESLDGAGTVLEGSNRLILLDRDGVLNVDRLDSVKGLDELEVEPHAAQGCSLLVQAGFGLAVVTNQSAVGGGLMDRPTLDGVNEELNHRLGGVVDHWFVCDHAPEARCRCRKPDTLLLEQAHAELGFTPADTWFVVDAGRDIEAARRFGCRPALVRTGKGTATAVDYPDVPCWDDLEAFARELTGR